MSNFFPMPNDKAHGGTVIASMYMNDCPDDGVLWHRVVVLLPTSPFYRVVDARTDTGEWLEATDHDNLTDATNHFNS